MPDTNAETGMDDIASRFSPDVVRDILAFVNDLPSDGVYAALLWEVSRRSKDGFDAKVLRESFGTAYRDVLITTGLAAEGTGDTLATTGETFSLFDDLLDCARSLLILVKLVSGSMFFKDVTSLPSEEEVYALLRLSYQLTN